MTNQQIETPENITAQEEGVNVEISYNTSIDWCDIKVSLSVSAAFETSKCAEIAVRVPNELDEEDIKTDREKSTYINSKRWRYADGYMKLNDKFEPTQSVQQVYGLNFGDKEISTEALRTHTISSRQEERIPADEPLEQKTESDPDTPIQETQPDGGQATTGLPNQDGGPFTESSQSTGPANAGRQQTEEMQTQNPNTPGQENSTGKQEQPTQPHPEPDQGMPEQKRGNQPTSHGQKETGRDDQMNTPQTENAPKQEQSGIRQPDGRNRQESDNQSPQTRRQTDPESKNETPDQRSTADSQTQQQANNQPAEPTRVNHQNDQNPNQNQNGNLSESEINSGAERPNNRGPEQTSEPRQTTNSKTTPDDNVQDVVNRETENPSVTLALINELENGQVSESQKKQLADHLGEYITNHELERRVESYRERLEDLEKNKPLINELNEHSTEIPQLIREIKRLKGRVAQIEGTSDEMQETVNEMEDIIESLTSIIDTS
jgi:hypothetical protein